MMKRLCVVVGLVCLWCGGALALDYRGVGNWADPNGWGDGVPPSGAVEVKVRGEDTILTLNTSTGDWGAAQRLRVYEGATMIVEEGAELLGAGWTRVGAGGTPGYVTQTGGLVKIDNERLGIGDEAGSQGYYTIRGGTLTHAGDRGELIVGARGGQGVFTVVGTGSVIQMGKLIVGDRAGASGTVEFQLTAEGVSPIVLSGEPAIDALGDETTSALVVSSAGGAPRVDVILIDLAPGIVAKTVFDTVNGEPAVEGAMVAVNDATGVYHYALTYVGGDTGNDIALLYDSFVPAPKVVYVTDTPDINGDGLMDDDSVIDWLKAEGYDVDARRGYWQTLDPNKIDELNAADLIIASCGLSTSNYDDGDEPTQWNSLTTPMINFNSWLLRTSRWKWMNSNTATKDSGSPTLFAVDPNHPIFAGVALDANDLVQVLDPNVGSQQTSFLADILDVGNGTLLASSVGIYTTAWIAEWAPGVEYYAGAGQFAGGPRMMFMATAQETGAPSKQGEFNLNEAGQQILRNMIAYLVPKAPVAIDVENASFEQPGTVKQLGWETVPGWSSDTAVVDSGVETDWGPTDGLWTGFLKGGDPSVWQLTHHVIGADDVYELKVDARITWLATTLRIILYYEDAGVRVPAALADVALADAMQEFTVTFAAQDVPDSVGKRLGIEFDNVTAESECWAGIDNVRLSLQ